jgi:hypothetical protein
MPSDPVTYEQFLAMARTILQPAVLLSVAGALLSLIASYWPGLNEWFAGQGEKFKPLCMLAVITVIAVLVGVLSFTNILPLIPATGEGLWLLGFSWIMALVSNQTTYKLSPQTAVVRAVKLELIEKSKVG